MTKSFLFLLVISFSLKNFASEVNKLDFPGCPENSICSKETGLHRTEWLNILTKFTDNKIDEKEANKLIQMKTGIPILI